ncbi:PLATZ transcription factor family protein [Abeliophyllum distichum]|uniref:PLATZ transcription factor family protein n=1 Tax=Abeliophyllum distichum TaxID=126358 RepID=A0ABD1UJQ0_9LAMI
MVLYARTRESISTLPSIAKRMELKKMVPFAAIPQWLEVLLGEKFFNSCLIHEYEKKNEENTFCLDCCISLCPHCLPSHQSHRLLQIRRYVYQDVLRLKDADKLIDCSFVQSYTTNSAKVVFLNQRPITRHFKTSVNFCIICDRNLQEPYLFCSISCKVHYLACNLNKQPLSDHDDLLHVEHDEMKPESVPKLPISVRTSSGSSDGRNCKAKRKRSGTLVTTNGHRLISLCSSEMTFAMNRRKGVPHRSPLC